MMQLARSASLVVVLLLLASAGMASAECAWVLWQEYWESGVGRMAPKDNTRHPPEVVTGFSTLSGCLRERDRSMKEAAGMYAAAGGTVTTAPGFVSVKIEPGKIDYSQLNIPAELKQKWQQEDQTWLGQSTRFFCLPDTVDPRGPKGK